MVIAYLASPPDSVVMYAVLAVLWVVSGWVIGQLAILGRAGL